jgi:hypothetical protein
MFTTQIHLSDEKLAAISVAKNMLMFIFGNSKNIYKVKITSLVVQQ